MDIFILCFSWVSAILITVCNGAKFALQPADITAVEGESVFFVCFVSDLQNGQRVSWMKDTTQISTDSSIHLSTSKYAVTIGNAHTTLHYTLQINNVNREDGRFSYSCRVDDGDETVDVTSNAARLIVEEIPADYYPRCEVKPALNYRSGSVISAVCEAEKTQPLVELNLEINGESVNSDVSPSENMLIRKHTFTATNENDGDVFTCIMTSTVNNLRRNCTTSPLVHNYKPIVTIKSSGKMDTDREAIFVCTGRAMPVATNYVWSFSRDIDSTRYNTEASQILRIVSPGVDLAGTVIKCTVSNSIGESSDEMTIVLNDSIQEGVVTPASTQVYSENVNASQPIKTVLLSPPRVATNSSSDKWHDNVATVAIIAGLALIVFLLLALLPIVCIKYFRKNSNSGYSQARAESVTYGFSDPRVRPQPIPLPLHIEEEPPLWTRTIGTQVTEEEVQVEVPTDPIYIEIPPDRYIYSSSSL